MSQQERVLSKHLFNLTLTGEYDQEVLADLAETMKTKGNVMARIADATKVEDDGTAIAIAVRELCDENFGPMEKNQFFLAKSFLCHQESLTVSHTEADTEVRVLVHRPKRLKEASPAIVYMHGGGVVGGTADQMIGHCSHMADISGAVVFNVDYRLAPEVKCPGNIEDVYSVLKYVTANAASLAVDPARVCILGESGGGYLTAALCVMLARKDESHLVKLAVPVIPMLDDYCFTDPLAMTKEEAGMVPIQKKIWNAIATDLEAQRASCDPLLFPAKTPEDLLVKFPPTVIFEAEFDFYITEATRFATRLRSAGRLLELVVVPGIGHGQAMEPRFKKFDEQTNILEKIMKEYLQS